MSGLLQLGTSFLSSSYPATASPSPTLPSLALPSSSSLRSRTKSQMPDLKPPHLPHPPPHRLWLHRRLGLWFHHSQSPAPMTPPPPPPSPPPAADTNGIPQSKRPCLFICKMVLRNFKSYDGEQQIVPLHKSFSAVVDPNGSNKSNVIDAILLVFGKRTKSIAQFKIGVLFRDYRIFIQNAVRIAFAIFAAMLFAITNGNRPSSTPPISGISSPTAPGISSVDHRQASPPATSPDHLYHLGLSLLSSVTPRCGQPVQPPHSRDRLAGHLDAA